MSDTTDNMPPFRFWEGNPTRDRFYEIYKDAIKHPDAPLWIGVDWAKDSGMTRGDVIKRDGNVTHLRFKTVVLQ